MEGWRERLIDPWCWLPSNHSQSASETASSSVFDNQSSETDSK